MAKRKKKNPLLAALKRSASGWGKAIAYMNSGKWADDFSKAVHRSGASKRAHQRAKAAPKREEWQVEYRTQPPQALTDVLPKRVAQGLAIDMNKDEPDKQDRLFGITKATNGTHIHAAIRNAQQTAAKQTANVSAHNRKGSKGVSAHKRKLNLAEQRAATAAELMKTPQPSQPFAQELREGKTPWAKEFYRKQKILEKEELAKRNQECAAKASSDHLQRAKDWLADCYPDDEDEIQKLSPIQVVRQVQKEWDGGWTGFENSNKQDDKAHEKRRQKAQHDTSTQDFLISEAAKRQQEYQTLAEKWRSHKANASTKREAKRYQRNQRRTAMAARDAGQRVEKYRGEL